jgi:alginate biosynthesis protein AlgX
MTGPFSLRLALALAVSLPSAALGQDGAAAPSAFGCSEVEFSQALPAIEGKDGVFFRTYADLRLQHPLGEAVRAQMGRLSQALADQGTRLVYVAIPTKSQAMPGALPDRAQDYGYDAEIAQEVYDEVLTGLRAHGIIAPDIMRALQGAGSGGESPMFAADFHWSASGARAAARAIGAAIRADASYTGLTPRTFESQSIGTTTAFSGTRRSWQGFCVDTLPRAETSVWETVESAPPDVALELSLETSLAPPQDQPLDIGLPATPAEGALDIFADDAGGVGPDVVLVGTSFSDSDVNNFAGFLQQYTGLEVVNYAITGGDQFGAISSYLTSPEFQDAPPRFLIWENPIYNNLGQFGPGQIEELIAAASDSCSVDLGATVTGPDSLSIDLSAFIADGSAGRDASILIDFGAEGARAVDVTLETTSNILRQTRIERGDRLRPTGRFYLDLGGVWMPDLATLSVRFDRALPTGSDITPGLYLCPSASTALKGVSQ